MRMKLFPLVLIVLLVSLASCNKGPGVKDVDSPNTPTIGSHNNSGSNPTTQDTGGFDSGGGNGIGDAPIESFLFKDIMKTEEFVKYVEPKLQKLSTVLPSLSDELRLVFTKNRSWYKLPIELAPLENHIISVPSSEVTTQLAIHSPSAIWINQKLYDSLPNESLDKDTNLKKIESRSVLLIHEAVMALIVNQKVREKEKKLTPKDYDMIRKLVDIILFKLDQYSAKSLHGFLLRDGFMGYNSSYLPLPLKKDLSLETPNEIARYLMFVNEPKEHADFELALPMFTPIGGGSCVYEITENSIKVSTDEKSNLIGFADSKILKKTHSEMIVQVFDSKIADKPIGAVMKSVIMHISGDRFMSLKVVQVKKRQIAVSSQNEWAEDRDFDETRCVFLPDRVK